MKVADIAVVYYNPHTVKMKKLPAIGPGYIKNAFAQDNLKIFTDSKLMIKELLDIDWADKNLLLMSSGNFNNLDFHEFSEMIIK